MVPQLNTVIAHIHTHTKPGSASEDYHSPGGEASTICTQRRLTLSVISVKAFSHQYKVSQCVFGWAPDSNQHRAACSMDVDWNSTNPFLAIIR